MDGRDFHLQSQKKLSVTRHRKPIASHITKISSREMKTRSSLAIEFMNRKRLRTSFDEIKCKTASPSRTTSEENYMYVDFNVAERFLATCSTVFLSTTYYDRKTN